MTHIQLGAALEAAGVTVRYLQGWDTPRLDRYVWREPSGEPAGHMHHHTASGHYDPNRDKANGYAGLSYQGSSVLYQERYNEGDYVPVYAIANAYPAPISSGGGDITVLERVRAGIEVTGRQGPDTDGWYGNTHYWNTEWVCKGDGSPVDPAVWEMMLIVTEVQNDLMGWTPNMHIAHAHHTRRKIDLWNGTYTNFNETIEELRTQMGGRMWVTDFTDKTWMTMFHSNVPGVKGFGRYYCSNDGTYDWASDPLEGLKKPWGSNPHAPTNDGVAMHSEKVNAINYLLQGFSQAAGDME